MKSKLLILTVFLSITIFIIQFNEKNSFKEDLLYNQNDLSNYYKTQSKNSNLVTRQKAIGIAKEVFKEGLGINLPTSTMDQYISLFKSSKENNRYKWNMSWNSKDFFKSYVCRIDSVTGKISAIYVSINADKNQSAKEVELDDKEALSIIKPLTNKLGVNLDNYDFKSEYTKKINILQKEFIFTSKNDKNNTFLINIDCMTKSILVYEDNKS